jgi:LysW-gamma-L-lysine carboxypeptidase
LAAFVIAAARSRPAPGQRWIIVGAVEEECSTSAGARFAASQFQPDWCLIGEPSGADAVTLGYKGRLLITGHWRQPSAHSAGPQAAIAEHAIDWWLAMQRWCQDFNANRVRVFEQVQISLDDFNTTSDGLATAATVRIGLRLPVEFPTDDFLRQFASAVNPTTPDVSVRVESSGREVAHQEPRNSPLVQRFNAVFRRQGLTPRHKLKTGTADMNVVAPIWGCPIVAYGPGDSALDHTPHEHLEIAEYLRAIRTLQSVLASPISNSPRERGVSDGGC